MRLSEAKWNGQHDPSRAAVADEFGVGWIIDDDSELLPATGIGFDENVFVDEPLSVQVNFRDYLSRGGYTATIDLGDGRGPRPVDTIIFDQSHGIDYVRVDTFRNNLRFSDVGPHAVVVVLYTHGTPIGSYSANVHAVIRNTTSSLIPIADKTYFSETTPDATGDLTVKGFTVPFTAAGGCTFPGVSFTMNCLGSGPTGGQIALLDAAVIERPEMIVEILPDGTEVYGTTIRFTGYLSGFFGPTTFTVSTRDGSARSGTNGIRKLFSDNYLPVKNLAVELPDANGETTPFYFDVHVIDEPTSIDPRIEVMKHFSLILSDIRGSVRQIYGSETRFFNVFIPSIQSIGRIYDDVTKLRSFPSPLRWIRQRRPPPS